ncbi:MAG: DUF2190 family protein [Planctomycetia bacterium]|nr:DUF2190 family protein [Planctomycetia bacterium]
MQNYIHQQDRESYTNVSGAAINPGDVVVLANPMGGNSRGRIGVAIDTIANGQTGELQVAGVVSLPVSDTMTSGISQGSQVSWDIAAGGVVYGDEAFNGNIGYAYAGRLVDFAVAVGATACNVALNQG